MVYNVLSSNYESWPSSPITASRQIFPPLLLGHGWPHVLQPSLDGGVRHPGHLLRRALGFATDLFGQITGFDLGLENLTVVLFVTNHWINGDNIMDRFTLDQTGISQTLDLWMIFSDVHSSRTTVKLKSLAFSFVWVLVRSFSSSELTTK